MIYIAPRSEGNGWLDIGTKSSRFVRYGHGLGQGHGLGILNDTSFQQASLQQFGAPRTENIAYLKSRSFVEVLGDQLPGSPIGEAPAGTIVFLPMSGVAVRWNWARSALARKTRVPYRIGLASRLHVGAYEHHI
jgi:hypothetical protein